VSIEALAYVKSMDLGVLESAQTRLLVYIIAENTWNDTFVCRLNQDQLAYEAGRVSDRTVRRHLDQLEEARIILRAERRSTSGNILPDLIRLVGYKRWYWRDHAKHHRASPPDKLSGGKKLRQAAPATGQIVRPQADNRCPPASGQQVSATYNDLPSLLPSSLPPTPPTEPAEQSVVGEVSKIRFAKGWDEDAQEAVADLRETAAAVVTEFLMPIVGTLNPPSAVDGASYVRQLGRALANYSATTIAKLLDSSTMRERRRDLPSVADLVQAANRIAALSPSRPAITGEAAPMAKARAALEVRPGDAGWAGWIAHIRSTWGPALAAQAEAAGLIVASNRWPVDGAALISPRPKAAAEVQS